MVKSIVPIGTKITFYNLYKNKENFYVFPKIKRFARRYGHEPNADSRNSFYKSDSVFKI